MGCTKLERELFLTRSHPRLLFRMEQAKSCLRNEEPRSCYPLRIFISVLRKIIDVLANSRLRSLGYLACSILNNQSLGSREAYLRAARRTRAASGPDPRLASARLATARGTQASAWPGTYLQPPSQAFFALPGSFFHVFLPLRV